MQQGVNTSRRGPPSLHTSLHTSQIFKDCDYNGNGSLDVKEFGALAQGQARPCPEQEGVKRHCSHLCIHTPPHTSPCVHTSLCSQDSTSLLMQRAVFGLADANGDGKLQARTTP